MKTLVIIPARGGSKGVPGKNIKLLAGKPLIQYTIEAAREVFSDEAICVSTDDLEIKQVVESIGLEVPFLRPSELATDGTGTREVILDAIDFYKNEFNQSFEYICLLQPTSPFRTAKHIKEALQSWSKDIDMLVSVNEAKVNPFLLNIENKDGFLEIYENSNIIRRQDLQKFWQYNGAIYLINIESLYKMPIYKFTKVKKYVMDEISSHDIDSMMDWRVAEYISKQNVI